MALRNQIFHRLEGRRLLLEENSAIAGLSDVAINNHQRHFRGVNQRQNRRLIHIASVKNNSVALSVGQHLYGFLLSFRRIVTIGDDQLLVMQLRLARRPAQQTAEIEAVKRRDDQTDAVAGAIRQRACQQVGAIVQSLHRRKHFLARAFFYLPRPIQHS